MLAQDKTDVLVTMVSKTLHLLPNKQAGDKMACLQFCTLFFNRCYP
jgi:hypothetical protein